MDRGPLILSEFYFSRQGWKHTVFAVSFIPFKISHSNSTQPPLLAQKSHAEARVGNLWATGKAKQLNLLQEEL